MVHLRLAGIAMIVACEAAVAQRLVCPYDEPSLASDVAAEVAWAAYPLRQRSPQAEEVEPLQKALARWRTAESAGAKQAVVHLLLQLDASKAKLTAAELEFPGNELARLARVPLLVRAGEAGVLFREFMATPTTAPEWEVFGDALCKLEHPAFVAELFTAWRPVLTVVVTEVPFPKKESAERPTTRPDTRDYPDLDGLPRLPRLTWSRNSLHGGVQLMRGHGRDAGTTLLLNAADVELARGRWLGTLHHLSYPTAFARSFMLLAHQRDHLRFGARVAEARVAAEARMKALAAELVVRKLLTNSRATPPTLAVVVRDERSEVTRRNHPLPKVD